MKKTLNLLLYIFVFVLISFNPINVNAYIPSQIDEYRYLDYVIDKYDINIVVNENNTFDITENITAYFNEARHGIYRTIPLKNNITRLDGTTFTNRARVSNVSVNKNYDTSWENGYYKIKIGDSDYTVMGTQYYTIKYTYNIGKDPLKDIDELYYNIIGDEWETVIGNVTFTITMPKDFDSSKLGFASGLTGSTDNNVSYNVNGNTIIGSYNGILGQKEALTVRMELPEGYFVDAGIGSDWLSYIMVIMPLLFLIISFILWRKYGKDDQVIETVEFYPPEGFNSLELAYLYKGKANSQDVVSLLIYLANKGYIKITEHYKKTLFSNSTSFKITKLKDYYGSNECEKLFLEGLFKSKKYLFNTDSTIQVTAEDLENKFYTTVNMILSKTNTKTNKNKLFENSTTPKATMIIFMIIISLITIVSIPTLVYASFNELLFILFLVLFYTPFYAVIFISSVPIVFRLFWGGFTLFHSLAFLSSTPLIDILSYDDIYLKAFLLGIGCIIGMALLFKYMPKRTAYGNEILGKIRGFKNFLETCEKEKLEALVMENPTYFYDILPYTYILGISDKWIKKFEVISIQEPSWYDGYDRFDTARFGRFMNDTMTSATKSMISSPSSGSSGSSSGGGSSGGGSGGGGGGSW